MRMLHSGGYCAHQYSPERLRETAKLVAKYLPELMQKYRADTIVVTGKSGQSVAFAALMLIEFPLCVVRKETDNSHGCHIEGKDGHEVGRYLILDDFIASGRTVEKIITTLDAGHQNDVKCVGVVEYAKYNECTDTFHVEQYGHYIPVEKLAYIRG